MKPIESDSIWIMAEEMSPECLTQLWGINTANPIALAHRTVGPYLVVNVIFNNCVDIVISRIIWSNLASLSALQVDFIVHAVIFCFTQKLEILELFTFAQLSVMAGEKFYVHFCPTIQTFLSLKYLFRFEENFMLDQRVGLQTSLILMGVCALEGWEWKAVMLS